ncbi:hypothetical protein FRC0484_01482 [Corynebacterium diphtheriae]|nr:hypothetical protein FRC0477_01102 [Corynebacterium diphtheriae]CAB0972106.1 hypothetical protein FRC0484_01482 [Corynebacterium diphtheriae]
MLQPHLLEQRHSARTSLRFRNALNMHGCLDNVFNDCSMREQIEVLEHHTDTGALSGSFFFGNFVQNSTAFAIPNQFTVNIKATTGDLLEVIHTAKQCGLTRARRADKTRHCSLGNLEVDAFKHAQLAVVFTQFLCINHEIVRHGLGAFLRSAGSVRLGCFCNDVNIFGKSAFSVSKCRELTCSELARCATVVILLQVVLGHHEQRGNH